MKCPICNGRGSVYNALGNFYEDCGHCQGTGTVRVEGEPMTNEEYIKSLNTEQLAGFIADVCYELVDDIWANCEDTSCDYRQTDKNYWLKRLKEKHHG